MILLGLRVKTLGLKTPFLNFSALITSPGYTSPPKTLVMVLWSHWGIKPPPKSGFAFSATWNDLSPILPPLSHHGMTWNYSCSAWKMHNFEWCYISVASQNDLAIFLIVLFFSPKIYKNGLEKNSLHFPLMPLCSI